MAAIMVFDDYLEVKVKQITQIWANLMLLVFGSDVGDQCLNSTQYDKVTLKLWWTNKRKKCQTVGESPYQLQV